ncbi:MAG: hypothetical protein PVH54_12405 [Gammaproteobacteria bacterium]|jgi:hypothetical protein
MQHLIRLRVFLLCCLLMIGMNVMLIMGGFITAGSAAGEAGNLYGCEAPHLPQSDCGYGFCAEKR